MAIMNRWIGLWVCAALGCASGSAGRAAEPDRLRIAQEWRDRLASSILPYWHDTAQDREAGGYRLADDGSGKPQIPTEKQLVGQTRMIWTFARAHRYGFSDGKRDYLEAARQGWRFLTARFLDPVNGGYFWTVTPDGQPRNDRKIIYGQSFAVYALVELHRAGGDPGCLGQAMELYRLIQRRSHDGERGGWIEHFRRDWSPILLPEPEAVVEVAGYKSANTHLHWMEALTELYEATRDADVRSSLEEALRLNQRYFYPRRAGESCFHRQLDWKPVRAASSAGLSYGHNVEFAWLMVRAEQVLGRRPSWGHFTAHLDHALRYGYDHERGGLYARGIDDEPATQTDKIWWVQSEMLAALSDALAHRPTPAYSGALDSLLNFIRRHQTDPRTGIWMDTVAADGRPKQRSLAHSWKANYHDVRAILKLIETFDPGFGPLGR